MPLLPDANVKPNVKQLYLPQPSKDENGELLPLDKKAWVRMDVRPVDGADILQGIDNVSNRTASFIASRIVDWNFIDESGATIPITTNNFVKIGLENVLFLAQYPLSTVEELTDDQKKTSTSTLTPSPTEPTA